jgi:hypothetical protein
MKMDSRRTAVGRHRWRRAALALGAMLLSSRAARRCVAGRAVVLALDGAVDERGNLDAALTEFYVPNEFVAALAARHTKPLFGASVNPCRPDPRARLDSDSSGSGPHRRTALFVREEVSHGFEHGRGNSEPQGLAIIPAGDQPGGGRKIIE